MSHRLLDLPTTVESAQRALGRIRYGSDLRIGTAALVLNPDSPLVTANMVTEVGGSPAAAAAALAALPAVFVDAGRREVVLVSSPSSLPELDVVAEEAGYLAIDEGAVLLLAEPGLLVEHEPGVRVVLLRERDEPDLSTLLIDAYGWPAGVEGKLALSLGHRLDDPRVRVFAAYEQGGLVGAALSFLFADSSATVGIVSEIAVRVASRRRGLGRALTSAAASDLLSRGAHRVIVAVDAASVAERMCVDIGFEPAYETITYSLRT